MRENHIGSLVIVDESDRGRIPVGMLTDRDIAIAVVAQALDPRTLTAGEVMSGELVTANEQDETAGERPTDRGLAGTHGTYQENASLHQEGTVTLI